jgi:nucleotide-binding universal stress UspA family protein
MVREAQDELDEIARRLHEEHHITVNADIVVSSRTAPSIIDYARAHDVDLIAMCTHGRGASRLLVGSVADALLRGSGVPVLLQRPARTAVESAVLSGASAA